MNLFVKKDDTLKLVIYAYVENDNLEATIEESDVPDSLENTPIELIFRRPSYSDSKIILQGSQVKTSEISEVADVDMVNFQDLILHTLLVDWDIKNSSGSPMQCDKDSINSLHPAIARTAVAAALTKIKI